MQNIFEVTLLKSGAFTLYIYTCYFNATSQSASNSPLGKHFVYSLVPNGWMSSAAKTTAPLTKKIVEYA